jgi:hypothetical protein
MESFSQKIAAANSLTIKISINMNKNNVEMKSRLDNMSNTTSRINNDETIEKAICYYGYLVHTSSDSEVSNLLGLFSTLGTIYIFTTGILLAGFTSVSQAELSSVPDGYNNSHYLWISITCGAFFGSFGVILSLFLYTSLAAVNIPTSRDDFLVRWMRSFKLLIFILFTFFVADMVCVTFSLFYLGLIKYQVVYDNYFGWGACGLIFLIAMLFLIAYFIYLHLKVAAEFKDELNKQETSTVNVMHKIRDSLHL